jgi:hypothetical protein
VSVTAGSTTATVTWAATGNSYRVVWGLLPFNQQDLEGEAIVSTNSYIITGLDEETDYAVVIYNNCAEGISVPSTPVNFTTTSGGVEPTIYTVVVVANNPAWGTVTGSGQYAEGSTVTITATANEGYHFEMWSDGNTEATRSFTITSNVSLTANFAEEGTQTTYYDVTVSSNNEAWGTVTGGGRYAEGSTATIAAVPNTGYRFVEWNDHNTDNPRTITVTADMSFTATFEAVENGIEDVVAGTVSLYPNPASTSVTLGLEGFEGESQVEVVDMNGRVVMRHEVRDAKLEMNVSELPQGAYFVRVTNGTRTAISSF